MMVKHKEQMRTLLCYIENKYTACGIARTTKEGWIEVRCQLPNREPLAAAHPQSQYPTTTGPQPVNLSSSNNRQTCDFEKTNLPGNENRIDG